jgi:WD40 repeat protein
MPRTFRFALLLTLGLLLVVAPSRAEQPEHADRFGDPLPPGALARLGTVRYRTGANQFALSPDGKTLATASDGKARLWDVATGKVIRQFGNFPHTTLCFAFAPDGKALAVAENGPEFSLWDPADGNAIRRFQTARGKVSAVVFSPNGRVLASGGSQDQVIRLWDPATGRKLRALEGHMGGVLHMVFSPKGERLASAGPYEAAIVRLWDLATGQELHRLAGPKYADTRLAFFPDGKTLAVAGHDDNCLRLWDVQTGRRLPSQTRHQERIACVVFSPDGKQMATGGAAIQLWDTATGKALRQLNASAKQLAFTSDSRILISVASYGVIRVWDTATGKELHALDAHLSSVMSVAFSPDGQTLATAAPDEGTIRVWKAATGEVLRRIDNREWIEDEVRFSQDGRTLMTADRHNTFHSWDAATGKLLRKARLRTGGTEAFGLSLDGKTYASACDQTIRLLTVPSGKEAGRLSAPDWVEIRSNGYDRRLEAIHRLAFAADGKILASVSSKPRGDKPTIRVWDIASGKELRNWAGPNIFVTETILALSPKGRFLAVFGFRFEGRRFEGVLHVWDVTTGLARFEVVLPQGAFLFAMTFSRDGKVLATGDENGRLRLWEVVTGKERMRIEGHQDSIRTLAFSPDGNRLASGSNDTTALVWDVFGRTAEQRSRKLSPKELDTLWTDIKDADAARAYTAMGILIAAPGQAVAFLKEKLRPITPVGQKEMERLIAELDSDRFMVRERAAGDLDYRAGLVEPALRRALKGKLSLEARRHVERVLRQVTEDTPAPERLRTLRALETLEHISTSEARQVLKALATGAPEAWLTREATAALKRIARRSE